MSEKVRAEYTATKVKNTTDYRCSCVYRLAKNRLNHHLCFFMNLLHTFEHSFAYLGTGHITNCATNETSKFVRLNSSDTLDRVEFNFTIEAPNSCVSCNAY